MVEATSTGTLSLQDLYRLQVEERCRISALYSALLLSQSDTDIKLSCAGHDWSLRNIQTICEDLLIRIPQGQKPINLYSTNFSVENNKESLAALSELHTSLKKHGLIGSRIELVSKGV